jgi:hypothetical protein
LPPLLISNRGANGASHCPSVPREASDDSIATALAPPLLLSNREAIGASDPFGSAQAIPVPREATETVSLSTRKGVCRVAAAAAAAAAADRGPSVPRGASDDSIDTPPALACPPPPCTRASRAHGATCHFVDNRYVVRTVVSPCTSPLRLTLASPTLLAVCV